MKAFIALLFSVSIVACSNPKPPVVGAAKPTRKLEFLGARMGDSLVKPNQRCAYGSQCCTKMDVSTMCSVEPIPKIGDIRIISAMKDYMDGKLISYALSFDPLGYDVMMAAMTTKYGPPDSAYSGVTAALDNNGKVGYDGKVWLFADGNLTLARSASTATGNFTTRVEAESETGRNEWRRRRMALESKQKADQAAAAAKDLGT